MMSTNELVRDVHNIIIFDFVETLKGSCLVKESVTNNSMKNAWFMTLTCLTFFLLNLDKN